MLGTNSELIDNSMVNISVDSTSDVPEAFAQTPQSLKMDLVLSHFSYTITDIPDISETYISNLFNDLLYSIKLATGQQKMGAKPILSDINLIFPCGSSTLVFIYFYILIDCWCSWVWFYFSFKCNLW